MKAVKVQYTVRADYVETNKQNIKAVVSELRNMGDTGVKYSVFIEEDGNSFVHLSILRDEAASKVISSLDSFKKFREQLNTGAVSQPVSVDLEIVDSSFDYFR